jgi:hypothetical protein
MKGERTKANSDERDNHWYVQRLVVTFQQKNADQFSD